MKRTEHQAPDAQGAGTAFENYVPVRREPVPDAIVRQIQHLLAANKLMPGDRLPSERSLAEHLGVSRTAVREAISRLEALHILQTQHGKGTFVSEPQYLSIAEFSPAVDLTHDQQLKASLEARACIDIPIAGFAALRGTEEDFAAIAALLSEAESPDEVAQRRYTFDLRFEQLLAQACKNKVLKELQSKAHADFVGAMKAIGVVPREGPDRHRQHVEIFEAVKSRDPARARECMARHLDVYGEYDAKTK